MDPSLSYVSELEAYRRVIRTRLGALLANSISECAMSTAVYRIGVCSVVGRVREEPVVAVNVHSRSSCPGPTKARNSASMTSGAGRS